MEHGHFPIESYRSDVLNKTLVSDPGSLVIMCQNLISELCSFLCFNSQGAKVLKIDLAQLSSQKRFDFRNS